MIESEEESGRKTKDLESTVEKLNQDLTEMEAIYEDEELKIAELQKTLQEEIQQNEVPVIILNYSQIERQF